jgi:hypothetical protein
MSIKQDNANNKILEMTHNQLTCSTNIIITFIYLSAQIFQIQMTYIYKEIFLIILGIIHFFNLMFQDAIIQLLNVNLKKNINNLYPILQSNLKLFKIR